MFGIKTRIKNRGKRLFSSLTRGRLSSDIAIKHLMEYFNADTYGHQANIKKADLGYGWIHYGFIRTIKPKQVLCIGSRHGYIPAVLAQACKDNEKGHVDFVDPGYGLEDKNYWTGVGLWKTNRGKELFDKFGLKGWIKLYVTTSEKFAKKVNKKYDYIYIDADHSYEGVFLDYRLFWPKLKTNGFMVFHDILVTDPKPEGIYGVNKLWKEIAKGGFFQLPFKGSGLGVVQKVNERI